MKLEEVSFVGVAHFWCKILTLYGIVREFLLNDPLIESKKTSMNYDFPDQSIEGYMLQMLSDFSPA